MCIGESSQDTLSSAEQARLETARFAAYRLELRGNEDGMTWATLVQKEDGDLLPAITICRVDPCILVMIEDRYARRQFRSVGDIDEALAFVQSIVGEVCAGGSTLH